MVCKNLYLRIFDFPGCKVSSFLESAWAAKICSQVTSKGVDVGMLGIRGWLGSFHVCCSNLMRCVFHGSLGSCFPFRLSICQSVWTLSAERLKLSCMMTSVCWVVIQLVQVEVDSQFSIIPNLNNIDKSHYLKCTKKTPLYSRIKKFFLRRMFKSWTATQSDMTLGGISLTCGNQTFWSYHIGIRSHFKHVATAQKENDSLASLLEYNRIWIKR